MQFNTLFIIASALSSASAASSGSSGLSSIYTTVVTSTKSKVITSCASTVSVCPNNNGSIPTPPVYPDAGAHDSASLVAFGAAVAALGAILL
jgi:hypothetical protein